MATPETITVDTDERRLARVAELAARGAGAGAPPQAERSTVRIASNERERIVDG